MVPPVGRQGVLIVAVELAVMYHALARSGDTLDITTWIHDTVRCSIGLDTEMWEASSQRLVVTPEVTGGS
jgi:acyl-CoA thioesterase FadM